MSHHDVGSRSEASGDCDAPPDSTREWAQATGLIGSRLSLRPDGLVQRRRNRRFALTLGIRYADRNAAETGVGRTIDMSSSGMRFVAERPLRLGVVLDIALDWPVALDGAVPLQFVAKAVVVRIDNCEAAVKLVEHEFKTRPRGSRATEPLFVFPKRMY